MQGGTGEDTFFYARGDKANVTIANFDFDNDKLKIASDDTLTAAKCALITSVSKISSSQVSGYSVIDLNYSTNLIKNEVAVQVKDTLKAK